MLYINRIIHQIWLQGISDIPVSFESLRASWIKHHPDWYYRLWDEQELLKLLKSSYSLFLPLYKKLKHRIQKIFFWQYLLSYSHGGVVVHLDVYCNENIEYLI